MRRNHLHCAWEKRTPPWLWQSGYFNKRLGLMVQGARLVNIYIPCDVPIVKKLSQPNHILLDNQQLIICLQFWLRRRWLCFRLGRYGPFENLKIIHIREVIHLSCPLFLLPLIKYRSLLVCQYRRLSWCPYRSVTYFQNRLFCKCARYQYQQKDQNEAQQYQDLGSRRCSQHLMHQMLNRLKNALRNIDQIIHWLSVSSCHYPCASNIGQKQVNLKN